MAAKFSELGMLGVLVLLAALFSGLTLREQSATDPAAGRALAERIVAEKGTGVRVWVATLGTAEERAFGAAVVEALTADGAVVVGQVNGDPAAGRADLERRVAAGEGMDVVVTTPATGQWLLLRDLAVDFPGLGEPRRMQAESGSWPAFLQRDNLLNIANQIAVIAIVAIGMTLVILCGQIDLSVGSLIALSAVLVTLCVREWGGAVAASPLAMTAAGVLAMGVCGGIGWLSGLLTTWGRMPSFIVTLAMMLVASGAAYRLADGQSIYQVPDSFVWLGRGADLWRLPNAVVLMAVLYGLAHALMKHSRMGRHVLAVGGNREAAALSGIRVGRVTRFAFLMSGALAGLGGVVMASQLKSGSPTYGQMYELYVIAAVVVGGASLSGGRGKIFGTLVGALIIAVIQNGMNLTNIESYTQKMVLGGVILGAVALDQWRRRR